MSVNILLSYAFHDTTKLDRVRKNLVCGLLLIDSGAFTAYTKGRSINLGEYAEYLERWRGCWDHAVTLDVIGDHDATMRNTRKLHERGLPVMPVFTRGGKIGDFRAMVRDVGYVCVGGLVGLPKAAQKARVGLLQREAEQLGGGIHALGIGSLDTLRETRPYSADASSISGAFRFGTIVYFDGRKIKSTGIGERATLTADRNVLREHGVDVGLLLRSGRMPGKGDRDLLMQAMGLAYACADEYLKRTHPVPPPERLAPGAGDGTHLYSSVGQSWIPEAASSLDTRLHPGTNLYAALSQNPGEAEKFAGLDSNLHPGTHLYSSIGSALQDVDSTTTLSQRLHPGTHLYSSLAAGYHEAPASLDRRLHSPTVPPIWRRWARHHTCTRRDAPDAS